MDFYSSLKHFLRPFIPGEVWSTLSTVSLRWRILFYKRRRVRHLYGGMPFEIEIRDNLAAGWYDRDWPELPEIRLLKRHSLRPGAVVFDLGAHQGIVALMLWHSVGPGGKVIAVEANPHNAAAARANFGLNGATNCTMIEAAVSACSGKLTFSNGLNGSVDGGRRNFGQFETEAVTIDDLASRYGVPDVLFIDVEGFECRALEGATRTLESHPDVFVEVHSGVGLETFGGSIERVLSFFQDPNYRLYFNKQDGPEFLVLEPTAALTAERFFLLAIYNQTDTLRAPTEI